MGDVYRAWDTSLEREVAVKVLAADLVRSADGPLRFRREAQRAAQVGAHPNVVSTFGAGEAGGWPYIAMELLRGEDLGQLIDREGALPPERALRLLEQAAAAIDHLHEQNPPIIHRDIKPANFMVLAGDRLILTDFGLARRLDDSRVTKSGTVIGSPCYTAPEQAMGAAGGAPVGKAADIYSLGAMAYEMLCGRPPFVSDHLGAVLAAHQSAPVPPVRQWRAELPGGLDKVFGRALAKRAGGRQGSAGELVGELFAALAGTVPTRRILTRQQAHIETPRNAATPWWRRPWPVAASLVIGLSLLVTMLTAINWRLSEAKRSESAAKESQETAESRLENAVTAIDPTALAAAMKTKEAADAAVANAKLTLTALRATASSQSHPTNVSPTVRAVKTISVSPSIRLVQPVNVAVAGCVVEFLWGFSEAQANVDASGISIIICRNGDPTSTDDPNCIRGGGGDGTSFNPIGTSSQSGQHTWMVESERPMLRSDVGRFEWVVNCGEVPDPASADSSSNDRDDPAGSSSGNPDRNVGATPGPVLPEPVKVRPPTEPLNPTPLPLYRTPSFWAASCPLRHAPAHDHRPNQPPPRPLRPPRTPSRQHGRRLPRLGHVA